MTRRSLPILIMLVATGAEADEALRIKTFAIGEARSTIVASQVIKPHCTGESCSWRPAIDCGSAHPDSPRGADCRGLSYAGFFPRLMSYTFREDKLVSALILFPATNYAGLKAALVERYGAPKLAQTESLQNRMGATFTSERLMWERDGAVLMVRERASKVDEGTVSLTSTKYLEDRALERKNETKAKAKDL